MWLELVKVWFVTEALKIAFGVTALIMLALLLAIILLIEDRQRRHRDRRTKR